MSKLILRLTFPDITSRARVYTSNLNAFRSDLLHLFNILKETQTEGMPTLENLLCYV